MSLLNGCVLPLLCLCIQPMNTGSAAAQITNITVDFGDLVGPATSAIPTYLDQVNPGTMAPTSPVRAPVFERIHELGADLVRYLHWDPFSLSYPENSPPVCKNSTAPATMTLKYTDGYQPGVFNHEAMNVTDEADCKAMCLAHDACVALTWVVRPLEPCNLYTSVIDTKDSLKGCHFWVKVGGPGHTSWDFSAIDPYVISYMNATKGHDALVNFSPIPKWMVLLKDQSDFGQKLGEYFSRIIGWYTKGGFVDECGKRHVSNHTFAWKYWEVLNEVDNTMPGCNSLNNSATSRTCAQQYTKVYDAIVQVLHRDHPELSFTALALAYSACPSEDDWWAYFLNASNHAPAVRDSFGTYVSWVSYHWYSENAFKLKHPTTFEMLRANPRDIFVQTAQFLTQAGAIQQMKQRLAPHVRVNVNEIGVLMTGAFSADTMFGADRWYWNLQAAQYAFAYAELARLGVDAMAASQLTGYPGNAPSISMLDWTNGDGTGWYWTVKMMIDAFGGVSSLKSAAQTLVNGVKASEVITPIQTKVCSCTMAPKQTVDAHVGAVYAQAFVVTAAGAVTGAETKARPKAEAKKRLVLLVNTQNSTQSMRIALSSRADGGASDSATATEAASATLMVVDFDRGRRKIPYGVTAQAVGAGGAYDVELGGFAVAALVLPPPA